MENKYRKYPKSSKQEYLFQLRKCSKLSTLDKIIQRKAYTMNDIDFVEFLTAADHRLAEIVTGQLFDKIPKNVWKLIY
ncbi:TPA: Hha/YmoA family nucleoid-associated regulatory protein [Escherichia coli]|jgi:hemolysin expression modulating protein|uniref:Hha/YmoA family nucleoid-associated regulatory protein n=1 Tax=Escherichia coli TaxID=562 RepID=A0AAP6ECB3_ECOLX|nr:Hha/YmoA family nucleoid-associated regulatory protein [Escherichia coli]HBC3203127.1 transcriptional regulator [Escherichia coli O146]HDQ6632015.1 transcriptional regulator [Escherichia coli O22:H16]HDQ6666528.1 transcriptional regulator [Escherichia coli O166:H28]HDQ6768230.1 transcriptional regulator [Escherichia coli O128:H2]HDQ6896402.1 transcriptional regulator [Escherichia coli O174:H8]